MHDDYVDSSEVMHDDYADSSEGQGEKVMRDYYEYREISAGAGVGMLKVAAPVALIIGLVLWYLFTH